MAAADEDSWDYATGLPLDPDPVTPPALPSGHTFAGYEVVGALGAGGMGLVFRVRDPELGREFALKVLKVSSPERRARFLREGQLTAALRHPGIVKIHTAGEHEDQPFLLYELVEGGVPLNECLEQTPRERRVQWVLEIARAVGYAHAEGVVHRDLKAENVLIDSLGCPRVIDFGLAFAEEGERLTRTGATPGTPRCMAPEQLGGEPGPLRVAATVDVWSLGVLLYRCLYDVYPFHGGSLLELAAQVCGDDPVPPAALAREASPEVAAVCRRALSKSPQRRYPDGDAFAEALAAALDGRARQRTLTTRWASLAVSAAVMGLFGVGWLAQRPPAQPKAEPAEPRAEPPRSPEVETLHRAVARAWRTRDYSRAANRLRELLKLTPSDPDVHAALAAAHYRQAEVGQALDRLRVAVERCVAADGARARARLEAWADNGWVRFEGWGPPTAPRVFDPTPYDFNRPWPGEDLENLPAKVTRGGAVRGDLPSRAKLGSWLQRGKWTERDPLASGQILQPLCWEGQADAQYWMAELLSLETQSWDGDLRAAEVWLSRSAAQGNEDALEVLQRRGQTPR